MISDEPSDQFEVTQTQSHPTRIGRYQIVRLLGGGGFGAVYLATDEKLERQVAIKVPHDRLVQGSQGASEYLDEARMVATLDHPNIVPVYDVDSTDDIDCFVVSKYIPGHDLRRLLKQRRFDYFEAATLIAIVADALHHAHKRGLVHRDVKPGNILIDADGTPYVADFGLALPEQSLGTGSRFAGTPAYMSPEQARGEGHRVDGRSDVFSLGTVFYELVTGKRAFRGGSKTELLEQVEHFEPRPLRQYNENIPKEVDRICSKALAKRAGERYWTAHDMADDIREFLRDDESNSNRTESKAGGTTRHSVSRIAESVSAGGQSLVEEQTDRSSEKSNRPSHSEQFSESQPAVVLPKGLRSFDAHDADFFMELLPGPRDRDGLPDSLRFWKTRIESRDADQSFSVGMIYGPSGCGKSSFVNAGLIPRLSKSIIPVFVEATAEFTEQRVLHMLHKSCPEINRELNVRDAVASIRRGKGAPRGSKVVLIFDQFERWLHSRRGQEAHDLVSALRQCDGERIQAILMVRSDFWMSVTRLLNELEVDLVQGHNFAAVDLFPPRHAKKVLIAFGRAFGALPVDGKLDEEQVGFVNQSIAGLEQDGKIICVRLALYAEMMKNRPWTVATLNKVGGTEGVGVSFLEDSFGPQANPKIRLHQIAAQKVLKSLLPDSGTMINIQMKSYDELFRDSGYTDSNEFDALIQVLDSEMRLISPTDPSGVVQEAGDPELATPIDPEQKYFRLAHDYLIPALRKWLNRKLRETRRGRTELLLAERSSFWNAKKENRYLPSIQEHFKIRALVSRSQWTNVEKAMMRSAANAHGLMLGSALAAIAVLIAGGMAVANVSREKTADLLVNNVLDAETSQVLENLAQLSDNRSKADSKFLVVFTDTTEGSSKKMKLHAAMALASKNPACIQHLVDQLPTIRVDRFQSVCTALKKGISQLPEELAPAVRDLAQTVRDTTAPPRSRLLSACALAQFDPNHAVWQDAELCEMVAEQLTLVYPTELAPLRNSLLPVASEITPLLRKIFLDQKRDRQQRYFATESLVEYNKDSQKVLFELMLECDERQFPLLFEALADDPDFLIAEAKKTLGKKPGSTIEDQEQSAANQANAAVALFQLGEHGQIWPLLGSTDANPRLRSFVIHRFHSHGSNPAELIAKFTDPNSNNTLNASTLKALMFAIGEYPIYSFDDANKDAVIERASALLTSDSADVKTAAEWLLRTMGEGAVIEGFRRQKVAARQELRESRLAELPRIRETTPAAAPPNFQTWKENLLNLTDPPLETEAGTDSILIPLAKLSEVKEITDEDAPRKQLLDLGIGPFGSALTLVGGTAANVSQVELPDTSKAFSYGCWFRIGPERQWSSVFSKMDPDDLRGFDVWIDGDQVCAHLKRKYVDDATDNSFIKAVAITPVNDGQWHQIIVSYDGISSAAGVKIFLDGEPAMFDIANDTLKGSISNNSPLVIGGRANITKYRFKGDICNVRIAGRSMHAAEIKANYLSDIRSLVGQKESELNSVQQSIVERTFRSATNAESELDKKLNEFASRQISEIMNLERNWYFTGEGQMMIRVEAASLLSEDTGNDSETENQQERHIDRVFSLSNTEVTVSQWNAFLPSLNTQSQEKFANDIQTEPNRPVINVSWLEAVHYCNWLSEREGIPENQWCYVPDSGNRYGVGMTVRPEFWRLSGYRLPTKSEWEFACRAGTTTRRCYGDGDELLSKYAWYQDNSGDPQIPGELSPQNVGLLKPNQLGFFDMHGNAMEWCFDLQPSRGKSDDLLHDFPSGVGTVMAEERFIRGGSYYDIPEYVRTTTSVYLAPTANRDASGFRLARTLKNTEDSVASEPRE